MEKENFLTQRAQGPDAAVPAVARLNGEYYDKTGSKRRFSVQTFGCQMNAHDSESLAGALLAMGFEPAADEKDADLVIYNTCCVRENAENRLFGNLGILKHEKERRRLNGKPGLTVALCGCMMQRDAAVEKIRRSYNHVDIIFGTFNLHRFPELLLAHMQGGGQIIDIWRESGGAPGEPEGRADIKSRQFAHKAAVNIMYGCDNFCSYCVVPYVRGRERSRTVRAVLDEVGLLAADGVKEIMLLGQNVNSYRSGENGENADFPRLLRLVDAACENTSIRRIRFMTSHPKDLSPDLISAMRDCARVCKHIHLPLQSGSTDILRLMNRRYTKESYLELINAIRAQIPDIAVTTDIIVGFPGETEDDFNETLDVARECRFSGAYTFLYSRRSGTPAAQMPDQVPPDIARQRFERLLKTLNPILLEINQGHIGETVELLVDEKSSQNGMLTGRAGWGGIVHFEGPESLIGGFVNVKITGCRTFYLFGMMI